MTLDEGPEPLPADPDPAPSGDEAWARLQRPVALLDQAPDAIVVLDVDTARFVAANPAAERLLGLTRDELLTVGPVELSPAVQPDGR
ncbi:MAG: PAS domain-containing protein, partial [Blastococcus sp.]|nr:PAS domain-containing protein [Blastococcus sp.]